MRGDGAAATISPDRGLSVGVDRRDRRVRAHPTGVRPGVAVADPLEVLRQRERHHACRRRSARTPRPRGPPAAPRPPRWRPRRRTRRPRGSPERADRGRRGRAPPSRPCRPRGRRPSRPRARPSSSTNATRRSDLGERAASARWGCRAACIRSFAHAFDPSIARRPSSRARRPRRRARAARRPARRPAAPRARRRPGRRRSRSASSTIPATSSAAHGARHGRAPRSRRCPGAASSSSTAGSARSPHASACSRPPPPTTRTFIATGRLCSRAGPTDDHGDRHAHQLLHPAHVRLRLLGQLLERLRLVDLLVPALELLVDRARHRGTRDWCGGHVVERLAVGAVPGADLHRLEARQHVELRDEQLGEAVQRAPRSVRGTASNQPQRRLRPVTVPNSLPAPPSRSPDLVERPRSGTGRRRPA